MKSSRSTTPRAKLIRRHARVRGRVIGATNRPRLAVHRSSEHFTAQIIDDTTRRTLVAVSDMGGKTKIKGTKTERATKLGETLASEAKKAGVTQVVFDRGGHRYHGRVKAFAEAARSQGLEF